MQKSNYFIYSILILFFSLFISACQDTQKDIEDEKKEDEISCFANRTNTYNEMGKLIKYSNRGYTKEKNILFDSSFNATSNTLESIRFYTYDSQNRLTKSEYTDYITNRNSRVEIVYNGNSRLRKSFTTRNGQLMLSYEGFYEQDKLVKSKYYDDQGNVESEYFYTFTNNLNTRVEYYKNGVLKNITVYEYEGQNITKRSYYNENNKLISVNKYKYQSDILVKEELYNQNEELVKYYVITNQNNTSTTQNNTITKQAYDSEGNILVEKSIRTYDSNNNIIYDLSLWNTEDYTEFESTFIYNEYGFITTVINKSTRTLRGSVISFFYYKTEYTDIQCY